MVKRISFGLRPRLMLLVLLAILPAFGLIGYTTAVQLDRDAATAEKDILNFLQVAVHEQEKITIDARHLLLTLAELPELETSRTAPACRAILKRMHKSFPFYNDIGVANLDGNIFCSALPLSRRINIADRGYFRRAVDTQGFAVGDYQIGRVTSTPDINFSYPALDNNDKMVSIVYVALDLDWLDRFFDAMNLPAGSVLSVIDGGGTILANYPDPKRWVGTSVSSSALFKTILNHESTATFRTEGFDGKTRRYAVTTLHESVTNNVLISVGIPEDVVFAATREHFQRIMALLFVATILAMTGAWVGGNIFILRRANALYVAAQRLAKGDLTARTGLTYGNEELGRVAHSFDIMATSLQRVNRALKTLSAGNRALVRTSDEKTLLAEMCRILVEVGGYRSAWIGYAQDDENKTVRPIMQYGFENGLEGLSRELGNVTWGEGERGRGPVGTAIRTQKSCIARNILTDPDFTPWRQMAVRHGYASALALPLRSQEKVIGALGIYANEPDAFDTEELELLTEAANDLGFGIAASRTRIAHDWAHATIADMSLYDKSTGLPNHAHFEDRLRETLEETRDKGESFSLLMISLNQLHEISDALGFDQVDLLIKEVCARIRRVLDDSAFLARMRGDGFGILLPKSNVHQASTNAQRTLDALRAPFTISNLTLEVNAVVGISLFPDHGSDTTSLLRHADVAMQHATKSGTDYVVYKPEFEIDSKRRLQIATELRHAIEANELVLHYQPKIDTRSGDLCGAEALVRWKHPTRGMIPPNDFIPLAEQTGLIKPLTEWVIRETLRQSSEWRRSDITLPIAVNLSARNLHDAETATKIEKLLVLWNADSSWLELEITEGAVMEDPEGALVTLTRLSAMGIALSIDDFGTGYSSLSYLKKLPVDAMKIDKSFVQDMLIDSDSDVIVRSTISLAHELGLKVVAEGVEREAEWEKLSSLGCDVIQGYYISKPLPAEQFKNWFVARSGK